MCVSYGFDGTETHSGILILIHIINYECLLKDSGNILYTFVEIFFINTDNTKYSNLTALLELSIEHLILSMISPTTESISFYAMQQVLVLDFVDIFLLVIFFISIDLESFYTAGFLHCHETRKYSHLWHIPSLLYRHGKLQKLSSLQVGKNICNNFYNFQNLSAV